MERALFESSQIITYKDLLLPHELDVLKKVSPILGLMNIALIWGCIALLLFCLITLYESSWLLLLLGVIPGIVLVGVLQNAIVELAHEAAHSFIHAVAEFDSSLANSKQNPLRVLRTTPAARDVPFQMLFQFNPPVVPVEAMERSAEQR